MKVLPSWPRGASPGRNNAFPTWRRNLGGGGGGEQGDTLQAGGFRVK